MFDDIRKKQTEEDNRFNLSPEESRRANKIVKFTDDMIERLDPLVTSVLDEFQKAYWDGSGYIRKISGGWEVRSRLAYFRVLVICKSIDPEGNSIHCSFSIHGKERIITKGISEIELIDSVKKVAMFGPMIGHV